MIKIKGIKDEDFQNYKKISMYIAFPSCTFKCEQDCPDLVQCQNRELMNSTTIEIEPRDILARYMKNNLTHAFVFGGLEPFDTFDDMLKLIHQIRSVGIEDDIVIYTGYYPTEIEDKIDHLFGLENIIIKYGRYDPSKKPRYDEILGVYLASSNQYAERLH